MPTKQPAVAVVSRSNQRNAFSLFSSVQFSSVHFIYFIISYNIHFVTLQPKYQPTTNYTEKEKIVQTYIRTYLMLYIRYFDCKGEQEKLD